MWAKAPKPRRSTEVFAPFAVTPYSEVSCTPGTCARMSGRLFDGERAMSSAVITLEEVPTMPLNCRPPVLVPFPSAVPGLVPSEVPVPAPREGRAVRAGRVVPLLSPSSGRARVLFGSVGGLTSTGGRAVGGVCAEASEPLSARMLVASRSALRRVAVSMLEDMVLGLGMTSVARHSEPSLTMCLSSSGEANVCTPRPTSSRVTTVDGRSPGSRVVTLRRLPRTEIPSGV